MYNDYFHSAGDPMMEYHGQCHCGNVSFQFKAEKIEKGLVCNCSLCKKRSAVMSDFVLAPEALTISVKDNDLGQYTFGNHVAKHHFCKTCGVYPFHQTFRMPGHYRVNLGCLDGVDPYALDTQVFDGASL